MTATNGRARNGSQNAIQAGRWVANPPSGTTLVLFGLRVNRWGRPWAWLPLVRALRAMLAEAEHQPDESGLLWASRWRDRRTFTVLSYWRDFDTAMAWAQDARFRHVGVWRATTVDVSATAAMSVSGMRWS